MSAQSGQNSGGDKLVPVPKVVPADRMLGEDAEETALLIEMLEEAQKYILSFSWCESIVNSYFAGGIGRIFAIFLFNISPARDDVEQWIWIVVGDIPPAYLPLEDCKSGKEVFETYISGMWRWVGLARKGRDSTAEEHVPPVNIPATPERAENLAGRLQLLTELVKHLYE